ncbi:MAG: DsbA family protein, partial [Gammaproteobacteria bacterium]|nr:DsbA family protein [Gammaproteobacteria bacterium]
GAQAQDPFPVTPELLDSLTGPDATWPHDPAVPDLPPLPVTDDPPPVKDSFLTTHYFDGVHPPKVDGPPPPLRAVVTEANPLKVDVLWSMRSPYSYLTLQRLVWLNSNYNVDLNILPVMPVAVRSTKGGSGKAGGLFGITYKLPDAMWDTARTGQYQGVPFKYARPDVIWQTVYPPHEEGYQYVHPPEKQPYIHWVTRLACYAAQRGKSLDYVNQVSYVIWSGEVEHWPAHVKERFNRIEGLDYDKAIRYIQKNPKKIDSCWIDNSKGMAKAGHGGVPLMVFQGEPFFGGDRFDAFVWRLNQSGLTKRQEPRPPFTTPPLRWPEGM